MTRSSFGLGLRLWLASMFLIGLLAATSSNVACRDSVPITRIKPAPPHGSGKRGPGDSLAKLSRRLLTDSNPRAIAQAMVCENVRLIRLYGGAKALEIAGEVKETTFRSNDEEALRRVDAKLGNSAFDLECGYPPGPNPTPIPIDSVP